MPPTQPVQASLTAIPALLVLFLANHGWSPSIPTSAGQSGSSATDDHPQPSAFDDLVASMRKAIGADPVYGKMLETWPWLTELRPVEARSDASSDAWWIDTTLAGILRDKAKAEAWSDVTWRMCRLVAPVLEQFLISQECSALMRGAVQQGLASTSADDIAASVKEWRHMLIYGEYGDHIASFVYEAAGVALSPGKILETRAITAGALSSLGRVPAWLYMVSAIDRLTREEPENTEEPMTYVLLDAFFDEDDFGLSDAVIPVVVRNLLATASSPISADTIADALLSALQQGLQLLRAQLLPTEDSSVLTVREAAAFLGIRPSTFHTHRHKYAGTEKAIPVRLENMGRGRGRYVIHIDDLAKWSEQHYRPRIKRRRR